MKIAIPKGTFDIVPQYVDPQNKWRASHLWGYIEGIARELASLYGFEEIRTPMFERTELFQRSIGDDTDIVTKEMYTFNDKVKRSMTLRPEGTASVMRAFLDKSIHALRAVNKFYYLSPMFRYERQQAGRYRQHHQFGIEAIGNAAPEQDAEIIDLLYSFFMRLGIKNCTVRLNSVGDSDTRSAFRDDLREKLRPHLGELSKESKIRFEKNPLRILDSKDPKDQELLHSSPSILEYLSDDCRHHFDRVCKLCEALNIPYEIDSRLVRGLDYYNRTVFEVTADELGAQNSIGAGGRYDGLIASLGGPEVPAIGFGAGIERILQTMIAQNIALPEEHKPDVFFISIGDEAKKRCFLEIKRLREAGITAEMDFSGRKVKNAMRTADAIGVLTTIVVGDVELEKEAVDIKMMETGMTQGSSFASLPDTIKEIKLC